MFDVIERLKSEWTDKYVVVKSPAPELARFGRSTGLVRTVNMNGRCLVEFDQFNNVGWYDIDPSCLEVVPKPEPKPEGEKAASKTAAKAPAKPAAEAAKAAPATGGATGKPSTADILAAARAKGGGAAAAPKPAAGAKPSTAEILAAARAKGGAAATPPAQPAATPAAKPSTAEILARARAGKAAAVPASDTADPAETPTQEASVDADTPVASKPASSPPVGGKPAAAAKGPLPTSTADKIAWCRAHDAKG